MVYTEIGILSYSFRIAVWPHYIIYITRRKKLNSMCRFPSIGLTLIQWKCIWLLHACCISFSFLRLDCRFKSLKCSLFTVSSFSVLIFLSSAKQFFFLFFFVSHKLISYFVASCWNISLYFGSNVVDIWLLLVLIRKTQSWNWIKRYADKCLVIY